MSFLAKIFGGGGVVSAIENIATEWIETDKEKAEAQTIMIKALDPNGAMRRQLSRDVSMMYKVYLFASLFLLAVEFFCKIIGIDIDYTALSETTDKLVELFIPITTLFGVIVSASFGVNYANVKQNK